MYNISSNSAGQESGNLAIIKIDEFSVRIEDNESGNTRGMNMVVINPDTGEIIIHQAFDTFSSSVQFDKALASIIDGEIVVIAVEEEASSRLSFNAKKFF